MKKTRILQAGVLGFLMSGLSVQASQTINTGQNSSSPYYSDFTDSSLSVSYTYASGIGDFMVTGIAGGSFIAGADAPGTGSVPRTSFTSGTYTLNAYVEFVTADNQWEVINNSTDQSKFTITGNLPGISPNGNTETLLTGNLRTGINTIGFGGSGSKTFEFLFTVSGGDTKILQDFFGAGTGEGGIILNAGTYSIPQNPAEYFTGDLTKSFSNTGPNGTTDTFVPESATYGLAGSVVALLGLAFTRKRISAI